MSFETQQRGELNFPTRKCWFIAVQMHIIAPSSPPSITYSTTSNSVTLRWGPPPEGDRNGRITQYRVQVLDSSSTILYDRNYSANHQLGFTAPNLTPYTIYTCRLTAFTVSEGPFVTMIIRTNESSECEYCVPAITIHLCFPTCPWLCVLLWNPSLHCYLLMTFLLSHSPWTSSAGHQ